MPSEASAKWSGGVALGGSGNQLAAQALWLAFNVTWSLLLVVPVTFVLRALGSLRDDPDRHVAGASYLLQQWKCWWLGPGSKAWLDLKESLLI